MGLGFNIWPKAKVLMAEPVKLNLWPIEGARNQYTWRALIVLKWVWHRTEHATRKVESAMYEIDYVRALGGYALASMFAATAISVTGT